MSSVEVKVPDVGVEGDVEVIEICVAVGDTIDIDAPIVVLETDKATVEVPSSEQGVVKSILVNVGDKVSEGAVLIGLEGGSGSAEKEESITESAKEPQASSVAEEATNSSPDTEAIKQETTASTETINVPDLGGSEQVEVIEVLVSKGSQVAEDDVLLVLESDKATMEIPSPHSGEIVQVTIKVGDKVSEGDAIAEIKTQVTSSPQSVQAPATPTESKQDNETLEGRDAVSKAAMSKEAASSDMPSSSAQEKVHAGPAVRKLARELGADLSRVVPTGPRDRILKEDLHGYIKSQVESAQKGGQGAAVTQKPLPDFSVFGDIDIKEMDKIQRVTAENMQTSWLTVPHVTQFDEADITKMERFRKEQKAEGERRGVKLTPIAFLLKACAYILRAMPQFNVSVDMQNARIIQKHYVNIGVAVDTPSGLVVPVIKDVDKKQIWELAEECQLLAQKAKSRKLMPADMQGGCFTISSLGGIGGTAFTPIVNTPEVAILGVSKAQHKPVYKASEGGGEFEARLMLPLSLSYDHRAINGADAARFTSMLAYVLGDLRQLLL